MRVLLTRISRTPPFVLGEARSEAEDGWLVLLGTVRGYILDCCSLEKPLLTSKPPRSRPVLKDLPNYMTNYRCPFHIWYFFVPQTSASFTASRPLDGAFQVIDQFSDNETTIQVLCASCDSERSLLSWGRSWKSKSVTFVCNYFFLLVV